MAILNGGITWLLPVAVIAQQQQAPVVGVVQAERRPITTSFDFVGRIEAIGKVDPAATVEADTVSRTISVTTTASQEDIQKALAA